jgi:hypothetical protein
MARVTIGFAVVFVALGVGLYFGTGRESLTALIPAFLGAVLFPLGLLARRETWRKHAMHAAVLVVLAGGAGSARGVGPAWRHLQGGTVERPVAVWGQTAMAFLCLVFVLLAIRSFVQARR